MAKAKQIVDRLLENSRVPGGFKATRTADGKTWEFKLDPRSNAYRMSVASVDPSTKQLAWVRNLGVKSFYSVETAKSAINQLVKEYSNPGIEVKVYPDEPWELRKFDPPGPQRY